MPVRIMTHPWFLPWLGLHPPFSLPYASWSAGVTTMSFGVHPSACPNHPSRWTSRAVLRDLLFCAGIAQAPSTSPNDLSAWGFLVEHLDSFATRPGSLRLIDDAASWDSRVKGLFGERLGMGLAAWLLWRDFDVVHIADAGPFIGAALADPASPYHRASLTMAGQHGELRPDYFCLSRTGEVVIAESKGAIGPPSAVSAAERAKAKKQVQNVNPVGLPMRSVEGRIAFATTIRLESDAVRNATTDTGVHVEDPEGDADPLPVPLDADGIVLASYCKVLQFLGHGWVTPFLRRDIRPLIPPDADFEEVHGERVFFLGEVLGLRVGLLASVAKELLAGETDGLHRRISSVLADSRLARSAVEGGAALVAFPNGVLGVPL